MKNVFVLLTFLLLSVVVSAQISENKGDEFNKFIREADGFFSQNKFIEAKESYEKALSINPSDKYALNQRDKSISNSKNKTGEEEGKNYQKIINKADEKFNNSDYESAKSLYQRALALKPNDSYPKRKIEEIDAKLNPKKVEKAAPLPDLGISSDLAYSDAEKIISDAEIKRQNRKNNFVDSNFLKQANAQTTVSENRNIEIFKSNLNIKEVNDKSELNYSNSKFQQDSTAYNIQLKENKISNDNLLYSKLLNTKEINKSISISNQFNNFDSIMNENKTVGAEMDVFITLKTVRFTDSIEMGEKKYKEDLNVKISELNLLNYKEEKKIFDSQLNKNVTISKVDSMVVDIDDLNSEKNVRTVKNQTTSNQNINLNELRTENNSDSISNLSNKNQINKTNKINQNDGTSVDSLFIIDKSNKFEKSNQLQALNQFAENEENLNDNIKTSINNNTQSSIVKVDNDNTLAEKSGKTNQDTSIDKLKQIDKNEFDTNLENSKKHQENEYSKVDQINTNTSKVNAATKNGNSVNDALIISNKTNNLSQNYESEASKLFDNKQDVVGLLENLESKTINFDDKAANSIGSLYPEGITEESFNKNDDQGLAYAVVTRRIVVKNGYGSVYIRTISKNSITYSKNGQPTTEHTWQVETQDAKLKRN